MDEILDQIHAALDADLYYCALLVSLALPDMCGALDSADGRATGARYESWFDTWVAPRYHGFLSGRDCYLFRCSMLHQGRAGHPKGSYSRILFVEPASAGSNVFHNNILNDALQLDVRLFCRDVVKGVQDWLPSVESTDRYRANADGFVALYPQGLAPYMVGVGVIA